MNLVVDCAVLIRATSTQAWAYVVEGYFDNHSRWDPAVLGMRQLTEGPIGIGTRGVETRRFVTAQDAEFEVVAYDPETVFSFRNTSGPFTLHRTYTFAPEGDATALTFRFDMAPRGPMKLLFPAVRAAIARQVHANIARIPALVEESADVRH